jgi:hypothetical protein
VSVLATYEQDGALKAAATRFGLRIPQLVDLAIDFEQKREISPVLSSRQKSGSQQYATSLEQLRTYRSAPRRQGSRYLVWGIIERSDRLDTTSKNVHE